MGERPMGQIFTNFEDIWYVGEVKGINLADLKKQFPNLTDSELETIQKYPGNQLNRNPSRCR